eukprot:m.35745 g.35745  ORF g.35745 m.35745 type:complete len:304 (-) comp10042_c0_seq1:196-1107(-)
MKGGYKDNRPVDPVRNLVAGGLTGCVAKTVVAPLDRLKILLQGAHPVYKDYGAVSGLRAIVKNEGYLALYRGNGTQMLRIFPYAAVQFFAFEHAKRFYASKLGHSPLTSFLGGSTAGLCSVFATYPLDLLRSRMAFRVNSSDTLRHTITTIFREEGPSAFFRGLKPTVVGMIPYAGVSFFTYDNLKSLMLNIPSLRRDVDDAYHLGTIPNLVCGGMAGAISQTVSYPLDVVRRRMQLDSHSHNTTPRYRGIIHALRCIFAENGMRSVFRGLSINYIREIPQAGVAYTVYELFKRLLGVHDERP